MFFSQLSLNDFEACPGVVVGAFPESRLVVVAVDGAVGASAPVPFAVFVVDDVVEDVLPCGVCAVECLLVTEMLPEVEPSDDALCLHPPVSVVVAAAGVEVGLVDHGAVGLQALGGSVCHLLYDGLHLPQEVLVAEHEGCLVEEP